jgi:predicted GIY-YIG superfamily endonuclease
MGTNEGEQNKKTLDRYLYYLRSVHNTCYYCLATYDFTEELERRCAKHVRGRVDSGKKSTVNSEYHSAR